MPKQAKYQIQNGDDAPFVYPFKSGSRALVMQFGPTDAQANALYVMIRGSQ
ncbi:hypothetical protein [Roseovarius nanhaiticus]|uniref:hypothetical protein n=1 Tax=Roseovarius nanhaiticus TaxID=573024 RepID=UPI00249314DC|nr:hypothetical protein [Roseovarius nanhaiticus]